MLAPLATPALCCGTALRTVLVSGATVIERPTPNSRIAGSRSLTKSTWVVCCPIQIRPSPPISGPALISARGPMRSASAPKRREVANMITVTGIRVTPAATAE